MPKNTIAVAAPIPGWDCTLETSGDEGQVWICTPSDEWIRKRAYFRFVTQNPPGASPFAYWITAEADFITAFFTGGVVE
jgi:hypothetical protein